LRRKDDLSLTYRTKRELHQIRNALCTDWDIKHTRIGMNPHYAFISGEDLATTRSELEYFKIYELRKKSKNAEVWTA
jgi:hypothetical protein